MAKPLAPISFKAQLHRPATPRGASWTFLLIPAAASARLPTRATVSIAGTLDGQPFRGALQPDGQGGHWLKVPRALREAAKAKPGQRVTVEITPALETPQPRVPVDLRHALAATPDALAQWKSLTPIARRDWILWVTSAKKEETRDRRVANTCDMLVSGKRRVCCFDRSGMYSKALGAPEALES